MGYEVCLRRTKIDTADPLLGTKRNLWREPSQASDGTEIIIKYAYMFVESNLKNNIQTSGGKSIIPNCSLSSGSHPTAKRKIKDPVADRLYIKALFSLSDSI